MKKAQRKPYTKPKKNRVISTSSLSSQSSSRSTSSSESSATSTSTTSTSTSTTSSRRSTLSAQSIFYTTSSSSSSEPIRRRRRRRRRIQPLKSTPLSTAATAAARSPKRKEPYRRVLKRKNPQKRTTGDQQELFSGVHSHEEISRHQKQFAKLFPQERVKSWLFDNININSNTTKIAQPEQQTTLSNWFPKTYDRLFGFDQTDWSTLQNYYSNNAIPLNDIERKIVCSTKSRLKNSINHHEIRKQLRRFHPDKNTNESSERSRVCQILFQKLYSVYKL